MQHLVLWSRELGWRLVIVGRDGEVRLGPARPRAGEKRESFERRRLAVPLRSRRLALGLSQDELGELVGVSRDTIQRWELARVPPRPIALVIWAQKLGYSVAIWPVDSSRESASTSRYSGSTASRDSARRPGSESCLGAAAREIGGDMPGR